MTKKNANEKLVRAIHAGDAGAVQLAIDEGASLTRLSDDGRSALTLAIESTDRSGLSDQTELVDCLLKAGADANDGGDNQPVPLVVALESATLYPVQVRRICESLVQHGADVSAVSPKSSTGATSPLEAAVIAAHEDLIIWILHHSPQTDVSQILERVEMRIGRLDEMAGGSHADAERQVLRPIIQRLIEFKDHGEVPPMSAANRLLRDRQLKAMANQSSVDPATGESSRHSTASEVVVPLEQLNANDSSDASGLLEGMEIEFVGSFLPSAADVESMPSQISLTAVESFQWCDPERHADAVEAFEKYAFKPAGLFQLAGRDHYVLAFVQPFRDIYGMLEQVDDNQMFCRILRMWPGDEFGIATNEEMVINVDVPGFDYIWESKAAMLPVINQAVGVEFNLREDKPVPATVEDFADHYCRGYQVYRERLIQVLTALEDQR